jgi:hypothetical protein
MMGYVIEHSGGNSLLNLNQPRPTGIGTEHMEAYAGVGGQFSSTPS